MSHLVRCHALVRGLVEEHFELAFGGLGRSLDKSHAASADYRSPWMRKMGVCVGVS